MIIVTVNREKHQFIENITLSALIAELNIVVNGIAIAINQSIIKKEDWTERIIQNNDDILIIKATQGG